jgi:uncharacterized protein
MGGHVVAPGERRRCRLKVSRLPTDTWLALPIEIVVGAHEGPALWLTAAVHGDEVNGVEIIGRMLEQVDASQLHGTLLAVPIVNVFGFIEQQRYLPDRRDLNRSFPGSARGSLAARLAHLLIREVVTRCSYGIDLHTGSHHRENLPHIRADLGDPETRALARAFGAPVVVNAKTRHGSLRKSAAKCGNKVLVFEAGEALRFDEHAISTGVEGVTRIMKHIGMTSDDAVAGEPQEPFVAQRSRWVRARRAGMLHLTCGLGDHVVAGQSIGVIKDTFGHSVAKLKARHAGVVIGRSLNPLVMQGDALVHIGMSGAPVVAGELPTSIEQGAPGAGSSSQS